MIMKNFSLAEAEDSTVYQALHDSLATHKSFAINIILATHNPPLATHKPLTADAILATRHRRHTHHPRPTCHLLSWLYHVNLVCVEVDMEPRRGVLVDN